MVTVRLTGAGRRLVRRIFPGHVRAIVGEFEVLSAAEQAALRRLCRILGLQRRDE